MSARGGMSSAEIRQLATMIKEAITEAVQDVKTFGDQVAQAGKGLSSFSPAQVGKSALAGVMKTASMVQKFGLEEAGQAFSMMSQGQSVDAVGALSDVTGALAAAVPFGLGGPFADQHNVAGAATSRVSAIAANIARAGGNLDNSQIAKALAIANEQEERALHATQQVRAQATRQIYPHDQMIASQQLGHLVPGYDGIITAGGNGLYKMMHSVGLW